HDLAAVLNRYRRWPEASSCKELLAGVANFGRHLHHHLEFEERERFLEVALERQPGMAPRIQQLRNDHDACVFCYDRSSRAWSVRLAAGRPMRSCAAAWNSCWRASGSMKTRRRILPSRGFRGPSACSHSRLSSAELTRWRTVESQQAWPASSTTRA